jgi:hypothetical protein
MQNDRILIALRLIAEVEDEARLFTKFKDHNIVKLIKEAEEAIPKSNCTLCHVSGKPQPTQKLEQHHISGKLRGIPIYPDTITVCPVCHAFLNDHQRSWLKNKKGNGDQSSNYFYGFADIFELLYNKTGQLYFGILARKFRSQAWHLRNSSTKRRKSK